MFLGLSFLVLASSPFPDYQLFEPALWNSGHFRGCSLKMRNIEQRDFHVHEPHMVLLSFTTKPAQFSSVTQSCLALCDPMDRSTPGLPAHHQLPESTQTHVRRVGDAIQPSHPLSSASPPVSNLSSFRVFSNESVLRIRWPKY